MDVFMNTKAKTKRFEKATGQPEVEFPLTNYTSYVVAHRVECHFEAGNHEEHETATDYHDVPRLLANANQTSILRGQKRLPDLEWYLEDNPAVSFIIRNTYDCGQYHEEIEDEFQRLPMPKGIGKRLEGNVRPYFSVLQSDARQAQRTRQVLLPSKGLIRAMRILCSSFPTELRDWDDENNLTYPYLQLWHCKDLLHESAVAKLESTEQAHINSLLGYLDESVSAEWKEAEELFNDGLVDKKHWAKLFRPNEPIVTMIDGEPRAYILKRCPLVEEDQLLLDCRSWEFDGEFFQDDFDFEIDWLSQSDVIPISDLPYFPLRLDKTGLAARLERRGNTFWSCRRRRYINYEALLEGMRVQVTQLRYMVDMNTYKLMHPPEAEPPAHDKLEDHIMLDDELPMAPDYPFFSLLLPAKMKGFGFHNKKWSDLLVEHINDIKWDKGVFNDDLVLDDGKKELIKALVTVHLEQKIRAKADFLAGKGEGLLILLHGGPGTGKTLTAESVAELAERPLYRVTCGDIGTNPEEVEKYLNSVLFIGTTWNCVVLLDKADVFLEERTKLDLQRNALVSVFLRVLEYYDGILILTSNRIGTFDEAFKSRVQLSLHYPTLTRENRLRVWENFVALLENQDSATQYTDIRQRLGSLAQHKLNGRQIRNTLNTARQLAQFRGQQLGYKHLNQAIQNVVEFEKYVTKLHDGQSDEEYAEAAGIRHSNKKRKLEEDEE
ncbi:hypothetical protein M3J07_010619 [Ascochyta lentis]